MEEYTGRDKESYLVGAYNLQQRKTRDYVVGCQSVEILSIRLCLTSVRSH